MQAANTTVNMAITPGAITYDAPASFTFSTPLNASFGSQTAQQTFSWSANYFRVQDLKGTDSGYISTLQLSGNLTAWSNTISWSAVSFRAFGSINLVSGSVNPRVVLDGGTSAYQALNTARNFIRRNTAANSWVIWYYGANIDMKIDVPAWQPAGAYTSTLIYTLIEN